MSVRPTPSLPLGGMASPARVDRKIRASLLSLLFLAGACSNPEEPRPPSGGDRFELSFERFTSEIEPILHAHGCAAEGDCHGGGVRGTFRLSPAATPDVDFDFHEASLQVDGYEPSRSPLLLKPLALEAGGAPHSAKPFTSVDDPDYQRLVAWVMDVTPARRQRVGG